MRILWASDNYRLYEKTLQVLNRLHPEYQVSIELGEPYYTCPLRFLYSPAGRPPKCGSCDLIVGNPAGKWQVANIPVVPLSEVQIRLTDPAALFDFLFSHGQIRSSIK